MFSAHDMWASYWQMLEIYKSYRFPLKQKLTANKRVSFSSYAGLLSSEDDFYLLDPSKLVVMETTNGIFNLSLYDAVKPESLMCWVRTIVSNRVANTGPEWVKVMQEYNSGTYNNQWMITDFKLWEKGQKKLAPNNLWIGSQIPGYFLSADVSNVVNTQGYWASYNVPYFPFIFDIAGYPALVKKYGNYWSYEMCPRARIFRMRQGQVHDLKSMQALMRYNDWKNDPLSLNCPLNQISSRLDLAPVNNTVYFCAPGAFGAVNAKITSATLMKDHKASVVGGPTHETLPPFGWTHEVEKEFPSAFHYGQPKLFNFDWKTVNI